MQITREDTEYRSSYNYEQQSWGWIIDVRKHWFAINCNSQIWNVQLFGMCYIYIHVSKINIKVAGAGEMCPSDRAIIFSFNEPVGIVEVTRVVPTEHVCSIAIGPNKKATPFVCSDNVVVTANDFESGRPGLNPEWGPIYYKASITAQGARAFIPPG